jgi:hypothetical protein
VRGGEVAVRSGTRPKAEVEALEPLRYYEQFTNARKSALYG